MATVRIMTHNLWKNDRNRPAWQQQGLDCSAEVRMPLFARLYSETLPDALCLQEVSPHMAQLLMHALCEKRLPYRFTEGGDTPILYRTDRFSLLHSEFARYPENIPALTGSFNNYGTKSCCLAVLQHRESGRVMLLANTHLWWKSGDPASAKYQPFSDEARLWQLQQLCARAEMLMQQYGCGCVLAGDLNALYRSPAVAYALQQGFAHAHDIADGEADNTSGLHRCGAEGFDSVLPQSDFSQSIDHILCKGFCEGAVLRFCRCVPNYALPLSDHAAAYIDLAL